MSKILNAAVIAALGVATVPAAQADIITADWVGMFVLLDFTGAALANTSIYYKGSNQYQTPISGTISFDTATGSGAATLLPFDLLSGTLPAEAVGISFQAIGDGMGGQGSLVLGNMLFNWGGNYGIPVSIVLDGAGFFGGVQAGLINDRDLTQGEVAGFGAVPASDGTYTNTTYGYLNLGPVPMATTEWNTTPLCVDLSGQTNGGCMGVSPSGALPLVVDSAANDNEYAQGDGIGIGGNPMADGPFTGYNVNFDITAMTNISVVTPAVPVPSAAWLLGSGLIGLMGVARRRKA
ncbi:MAG: VPLPA-CTERM sorting domain-containing protein [Gammaproteobacteria bacterium]|nr:VPLPA-CTERM sorting domain-containing protein [Gammaproteobacteria bacterium]